MLPPILRRVVRVILLGGLLLGWLGGAVLRAQSPDPALGLTEAEVAWLRAHPVVRWSPDPHYAPVEFQGPDGKPTGLAVDYLQLIERKLGIRLQVVPVASWDEALQALEARRTDLLSNITESPERRLTMAFTKSFLELPDVLVGRVDGPTAMSLSDLSGRRVGFVKGYQVGHAIQKDHPKIHLEAYPDLNALLEAVSYGRLDVAAVDMASTSWTIEHRNLTNLRVVGSAGGNPMVSIAVRGDWPALARILDKALDSIPQDEREVLRRRWMALRIPEASGVRGMWVGLGGGVVGLLGLAFWLRHRTLARAYRAQTAALADERDRRRRVERLQVEYISRISFELRTPLTVLLGNLKLVHAGISPEQAQDLLDSALRACEQMNGLVHDLLEFEQIQQGRLQLDVRPMDWAAWLVRTVEAINLRLAPQELHLQLDAHGSSPRPLAGDQDRLTQALKHLVRHAWTSRPPDQGLELRATWPTAACLRLEIPLAPAAEGPPAGGDLFAPFAKQDPGSPSLRSGSGLELSIAKALVEAHHGRVGYDPETRELWMELPAGQAG